MKAWLVLAVAAVVAGCVPVERDPARDIIGVSSATGARTDAIHDVAARDLLTWKASQICTVPGYDLRNQDVEPAENHQQIVDWQLRCQPYTAMTPVRFR
ncbi:MAG: hypothetical protein KGJ66_05605 [Alphaproteobacteria bacterium]|nr:hypothetical protein [Alphaproteobacteria bacterium]